MWKLIPFGQFERAWTFSDLSDLMRLKAQSRPPGQSIMNPSVFLLSLLKTADRTMLLSKKNEHFKCRNKDSVA